VTLGTGTVPLADALERLARAAGVHLTYSSDLLPDARKVCLGGAKVHVGDALEWWLAGTGLTPAVLADDRVVLVPRRAEPTAAAPLLSAHTTHLDRVEVRDDADDEAFGGIPGTRTVLTTTDLEPYGSASIAEALSATVPGMWTWATAPTAISSGQTLARGASSFGAASPKVYVDGIEVANPLLLSQLSADRVARIEVIRGPQGSALYGSGAIGGVIRVTTRQALASPTERAVSVRSLAGVAASEFAPLGVLVQEHAVSGHAGDGRRSLGASVATATVGEFVPGAFNRQVQASIGGSVLGTRTRLQVTGQFLQQRVGSALSPAVSLFANASRQPAPRPGAADTLAASTAPIELSPSQSSREVTLGATLSVQGRQAVHTFVAGFDGYRLTNDDAFLRTTGDSLLQAAAGSAGRASVSWNAVRRFGSPRLNGTMTLGVEHSSLSDATIGLSEAGRPGVTARSAAVWRHATGALASTQVRLFQSLVVSGGLRFERHEGFTVFSGNALLPTVGAAWQYQSGPAAMTLRAGYGKAIQPPRVGSRADVFGGRIPSVFTLMPEEQSGYELGADVRLGGMLSVSVTRFDQMASNLIQRVGGAAPGARGNSATLVLYDNVGAIANRGWELESRAVVGRLSVTGALGITDSRVRRVASTYRGDLRAGDRVLQVPARTYSLGARWAGDRWGTSLLFARAADWVNYDWMALTATAEPVRGQALRSYWAEYGGVSRLRASVHRDLTGVISLVASGENLLGIQRGEPDNVTIVPGRTLRIGLRAGAR
jgi:iron complex outermembrane receptor protein